MENGEDADAGAEALGIGGDSKQCLGRDLEQKIVDHCLVVIGDVGDPSRQRKHCMEVWHRQ